VCSQYSQRYLVDGKRVTQPFGVSTAAISSLHGTGNKQATLPVSEGGSRKDNAVTNISAQHTHPFNGPLCGTTRVSRY